jgi:hypothetical protein
MLLGDIKLKDENEGKKLTDQIMIDDDFAFKQKIEQQKALD